MKKYNHQSSAKLVFLISFLCSLTAFAQNDRSFYTIGLANVSSTTNTLEMDVTITIDNPAKTTKLSQLTVGINYNESILNNGTPCVTKNCGSWLYVGGKSNALKGLIATVNTTNSAFGHLRIVGIPLSYISAISIPNGTYTLGRYRYTNSTPWTTNADAELWLQPTNENNRTNTIVSVFPTANSRKLVAYSTKSHANSALQLEYTKNNPMRFVLNQKGAATNFNSLVYPNPFTDSFHLDVSSASQNTIHIKIYDMLGKMIENKTIETSEIQSLSIGANYPSGIYNLNVSQDKNTQTLRIIKR